MLVSNIIRYGTVMEKRLDFLSRKLLVEKQHTCENCAVRGLLRHPTGQQSAEDPRKDVRIVLMPLWYPFGTPSADIHCLLVANAGPRFPRNLCLKPPTLGSIAISNRMLD